MAVIAAGLVLCASTIQAERARGPVRPDSRDLLLAALGTATIECLGTVGPSSFSTDSGALARTFDACRVRNTQSLAQIDALLAVQFSAQGRADDLAGHFVRTWDAFVKSFPHRRIRTCPTWTLMNVIDAPTTESVARFLERGWDGKENRRYQVASPECGRNGRCAVRRAEACAGGFGAQFIAATDPERSLVEVDPAWWLTTYEYGNEEPDDPCNPFTNGEYAHGLCRGLLINQSNPGALYGSLERAGEKCCFWNGEEQRVEVGLLQPIDCGGGFLCMTYCMPQG
jgi:hypothetical protein